MKKRSLVAGFVIALTAAVVAFPAAAFAQTPAPAPSDAPSLDPSPPGPGDQSRPARPGGGQGPGFRGGPGYDQGGQDSQGGPGGRGYGFGYGGPGGGYGSSGPGAFVARRSWHSVSPLAAVFLTLVGLGLLAGAGALGYRLGRNRGSGGGDARALLDSRYARGEIDSEEYQQRRVDLAGAH